MKLSSYAAAPDCGKILLAGERITSALHFGCRQRAFPDADFSFAP
jgi:hypothetical protein